mmetsp:Transcript_2298/g.3661  ORF Transcript_2298/g.3661 Transcript_2298/m.3661 type:complete len:525 (-) Transcript_2298:145-1719(-)
MVVLGLCALEDDELFEGDLKHRVSPLAHCGVEVEARRRLSARKTVRKRRQHDEQESNTSPPLVGSLTTYLESSSPEIRKALDKERDKWAEKVRERQINVRKALDEAGAIDAAMKNGNELPNPTTPGGRAAYEEARLIRDGLRRLLAKISTDHERVTNVLQTLPEPYNDCYDAHELRHALSAFLKEEKERAQTLIQEASSQELQQNDSTPTITPLAENKTVENKTAENKTAENKAIEEAKTARARSQAIATNLESTRELKISVCRLLKKTIGAAINSVQNERASVEAAQKKLITVITDPLGRNILPKAFEPTPQTIAVQYPQLLANINEQSLIIYVRHYICERIMERLLDDTFDHKRDIFALAHLLQALVTVDPLLRRIIQGTLLATSTVTIAVPDTTSNAERIAALLAALTILDQDLQSSVFGGLSAAWTWLARYTNRLPTHPQANLDLSALILPLIVFLEISAFALAHAADNPFLNLLTVIESWWLSHNLERKGPAAIKFADILDHARKRTLKPPDALLTFLA